MSRLALLLLVCLGPVANAQQITTIAGNGSTTGSIATNASLQAPASVAVSSTGEVYFSATTSHAIYRLNGSTLTLIAGTPGISGNTGDGGAATNARLNSPNGITLDASGNLYIADTSNHRIRKVTAATGVISLVAGTSGGFQGDGADATLARLNNPRGIAVDSSGNLFIGDTTNHRIRKVTSATGFISTVAGLGLSGPTGDGSLATTARLNSPRGVAVDASGDLYIADTGNNRVRKVSGGIITAFAGTGTTGYTGDSGAATSATLRAPQGVFVDSSGVVYIADTTNHAIRMVSSGTISTVAGIGSSGFAGDGGTAISATLNAPQGVAVNSSGNVFIADTNNHRFRKVAGGNITTVAGNGFTRYGGDGEAALLAAISSPQGIAFDSSGNLYFADSGNSTIRKITPSGIISTFAGTGTAGFSGDNGPAASAQLNNLNQIFMDSSDNLYIADTSNGRIRKVTSAGVISTVAGIGSGYSGDGGAATSANLGNPYGVSVDSSGNIFIGDTNNHRIRKVDAATGLISTVAGTGSFGLSGDGGAATSAQINTPLFTTTDASGNLYLSDYGNNRIRKVTPAGVISTFVGTTGGSSGDGGPAASAQISNPRGIAFDSMGNFYIADSSNNRIRKVTSDGTISTLAGTTLGYSGDGGAATSAQLSSPYVVAAGPDGVYISDSSNRRIRRVTTLTAQTITFGALSNKTYGDPAFTVSATASSSLAVTFGSSTTPVCTVSGSTVTIVAPGTCTITADQAGDSTYGVATQVPQSFTVGKASQAIVFSALSNKSYGDVAFLVTATASSGLALTFGSSTTSVCTVSGSTVTIVALGTCTVTADQAGNSNYNAATQVPQSFTVGKANQSITFGALSDKTFGDAAFLVSASASSSLAVAFGSSTTSVCTVSGSTVTLIAAGTCTITADQAGNSNYNAATQVPQSFTVGQTSQSITFGSLSDKSYGDGAFTVSATASSSLTVTFGSSTTSVCTVSGTSVTIVAAGVCTITADQAGNSTYGAATQVPQSFTVNKASQSITFSALSDKNFGNAPFTVSATASSGLAVTLASSTAAVCTVSGTTVTIIAAGTCTIAADQAGNTNYSAATQVPQSFTIGKASQTISFGALSNKTFGDAAFAVSAAASSDLTVTYGSSTTSVCTVSGATVTIVGIGLCTVTVDQAGDSNYNTAPQATQSFTVSQASQSIIFSALSSKTLGDAAFTVSATASSGLTVTFASSTTWVCTVSGSTVTLVGLGTCTITADQAGNSNYTGATQATQSFAVGQASQTITFGALSNKTFGDGAFTVSATASSGLAVTFASSTPSVCTVSGSTVTIVAAGICTVTADQAGNSTHEAAAQVPQSGLILPVFNNV